MNAPPEKKAPRSAKPERKAARRSAAQYGSKPPLASDGEPTPTKALLSHAGDVWLFEVREGHHRISYVVERAERTWPFGLRFSAESKFLREVNKAKGGRENGE
jgi:hypothetical protein